MTWGICMMIEWGGMTDTAEFDIYILSMKDTLLDHVYRRIVELESLLLLDASETQWPAEVEMVFTLVDNTGRFPAHHQQQLRRLHNG